MFDFLLAIDPVAFELFGLEVRWYALCILSGAFLTLFFSQRIIRSYGYGKEIKIRGTEEELSVERT